MTGNVTFDDTICAISTPAGTGGIAVVRVSGADALTIVSKCWKGIDLSTAKSHTAHLGRIIDTIDGTTLDEVVLTLFRTPHSFTGEDVVEISCHGSQWIQRELVNTLIRCGCRAATGGEFTRRAFSNGRIDLSQAEAIADVIASSSRASHRIAISQMRGDFSRELNSLREQLLKFASLMELELDFSEEEVEFADRKALVTLAKSIKNVVDSLADSFSVGNDIKNGLPVAIVGETNAGKSTLLNYLLHDDRALVSDIHGTTRDVIEDTITLGGVLFRFIDTAGIRETSDTIENMGIERTFRKIDEAQLALWIIDGPTHPDTLKTVAGRILPGVVQSTRSASAAAPAKQLIAVVNKSDLMTEEGKAEMDRELDNLLPVNAEKIFISARQRTNLDRLEKSLIDAASLPDNDANEVIVTNARHFEALIKAGEALARSIQGLETGISGDFVSQDIRECMHYLGEITGEITPTDILTSIFSHFCIGK